MGPSVAVAPADDSRVVVLPWILRIGVAGCYIGHGAWGIVTKADWLPYFAVAGIHGPLAWKLMPWIGTMDIAMGLLALVWPCRALFLWAALWTVGTALLRPLAGEPFWEFLERAGNYGVPIALLAALGVRGAWFARIPTRWPNLTNARVVALSWTLRATTALLLVGHAGLGFFSHKAGLTQHYSSLGLENAGAITTGVGAFEFLLAVVALATQRPAALIAICLWKIASESLFLVSGALVWELIERFGSYAAPLALAVLIFRPSPRLAPVVPTRALT